MIFVGALPRKKESSSNATSLFFDRGANFYTVNFVNIQQYFPIRLNFNPEART